MRQLSRTTQAPQSADSLEPGCDYPSVRYFQIHFEHLAREFAEVQRQLRELQQQVAELSAHDQAQAVSHPKLSGTGRRR